MLNFGIKLTSVDFFNVNAIGKIDPKFKRIARVVANVDIWFVILA